MRLSAEGSQQPYVVKIGQSCCLSTTFIRSLRYIIRGLAIELRLVSFYYDRGFGQETAPPARLLCAIPYMSNFGVCENMRLFQCIQCGEKLGPGNATFGSEMCNKCRMQQAGIKQTDRAHTRPKGTAPRDYQELVCELRPAATPPGYLQLAAWISTTRI